MRKRLKYDNLTRHRLGWKTSSGNNISHYTWDMWSRWANKLTENQTDGSYYYLGLGGLVIKVIDFWPQADVGSRPIANLKMKFHWSLHYICLGFPPSIRSCEFESNGEVYSIHNYGIKFFSYLRQVGGFLWLLRFPPSIKLTATITKILLKVELNTITLNKSCSHDIAENILKVMINTNNPIRLLTH